MNRISYTPVLAILVSLLQGVFFSLTLEWNGITVSAVSLSTANLIAGFATLLNHSKRFLTLTVILYSAQLWILIFWLDSRNFILDHRLLLVALILLHFAIVLSVTLGEPGILTLGKAILFSFSFAIAFFLLEILLGIIPHPLRPSPLKIPEWSGKMIPHPVLKSVFPPNSMLFTYYPSNPRGYFKQKPNDKVWLRQGGGASANLLFPIDSPGVIRIVPQKLSDSPSDIQLNVPGFLVKAKHRYWIRFRARADRPRTLFTGVAKANNSWSGLGFYKSIGITQHWQNFNEKFSASEEYYDVRIHFDLGASEVPVEFSDIKLGGVNKGASDAPSNKFFVSYRFNALGCRGSDYAIPAGLTTERVLLLGDAYTLGSGVYEYDTFARRLEHSLNEKWKAGNHAHNYEVVNCGIQGYGTRQEKLFYELYGAQYNPQVVLLTIVLNDDVAFNYQTKRAIDRSRGSLEFLFYSWAKIMDLSYSESLPNFKNNLEDILQLNAEVRKNLGSLAVIIFRNNPDFRGISYQGKVWNCLVHEMSEGLAAKQIPMLDLGPALYEKHSEEDLQVYPGVDRHLNEVAHAIAAEQIQEFLTRNSLLH